jgi:nucleoside-diphosphate-sugar epimerase
VTYSILITGAGGFLGSNLARALRKRFPSAEIVAVDNHWTGCARDGDDKVFDWYYKEDVADNLFAPEMFDEIFHLASPASPNHYQDKPFDTIRANVFGLFNCLKWLKPGGTIFFSSTSEVYGDPLISPQPESYKGSVSCTGPRACYDEAKRLCETMMFDAHRKNGVKIKVVRYFNAYGIGTLPNDGRAVSNFVTQALRGDPITVYGTGEQTRCFTYMEDIIAGTLALMYETGDFTGPLNLGTDRETSVNEIARYVQEAVRKVTGIGVPIIHLDPVVDDPQQRKPDLTLARKLIDWDPKFTYEEGIARTIRYFQSIL